MNNYIKKNIDKLISTGYFKEIELTKGEILFNVGDINNNLYYIKEGILSVFVIPSLETDRKKELAILEKGNITGEGALLKIDSKKKAGIQAKTDCKLIYIDIKNDLDKLFLEKPILGKEILVYLLSIEHDRINNLNFHITANYEINNLIRDIGIISMKSIYKVIDGFKTIINADRILFLERHESIDDIIKITYDTNFEGISQRDKIYDKENDKKIINLKEIYNDCGIDEEKNYIYINDISIGDFILGYFILIRNDKPFSDNDQKVISGITNSFGGLIKQYKNQIEDQNRMYLKSY